MMMKYVPSDTEDTKLTDYLNNLNMKEMFTLTPYLMFLVTLMVCGVLGNTTVFLVYYTRFKSRSPRNFVLAMSLCDLLTNVWALLADMLLVRYTYTFRAAWACKLLSVVMSVLVTFSGLVLVAVAVERQKKVCGTRVSSKSADRFVQRSLLTCASLAVALALPVTALYGNATMAVPGTDITAITCGTDDAYVHSIFRIIYTGLFAAIFVLTVITMIFCYVRIGIHLSRHKKRKNKLKKTAKVAASRHIRSRREGGSNIRENDSNMPSHSSMDQGDGSSGGQPGDINVFRISIQASTPPHSSSMESILNGQPQEDIAQTSSEESNEATRPSLSVPSNEAMEMKTIASSPPAPARPPTVHFLPVRIPTTRSALGKPIPSRTTLMLFVLTVVFIINYLPYIVIETLMSVAPESSIFDMDKNLQVLCFRSFYLNSVINPFVYSFCSARFRYECLQLFQNLRRCWA